MSWLGHVRKHVPTNSKAKSRRCDKAYRGNGHQPNKSKAKPRRCDKAYRGDGHQPNKSKAKPILI